MRIRFVIFLVIGLSVPAIAQNHHPQENTQLKKFDERKWKDIVGDQNYEEKPVEPPKPPDFDLNGWEGFSLSPQVLRVLGFTVVIVLFAFVLYYIAQNIRIKQNAKPAKVIPGNRTAPVEDIEELDIEDLLRDALTNGDLRVAVRIQYLLLLKKLNEAGLIIWKKDKTNRDYLSELYERTDYYNNVRDLTLAYELVWYGERTVSNESFQRLSGEFESVNKRITPVA